MAKAKDNVLEEVIHINPRLRRHHEATQMLEHSCEKSKYLWVSGIRGSLLVIINEAFKCRQEFIVELLIVVQLSHVDLD